MKSNRWPAQASRVAANRRADRAQRRSLDYRARGSRQCCSLLLDRQPLHEQYRVVPRARADLGLDLARDYLAARQCGARGVGHLPVRRGVAAARAGLRRDGTVAALFVARSRVPRGARPADDLRQLQPHLLGRAHRGVGTRGGRVLDDRVHDADRDARRFRRSAAAAASCRCRARRVRRRAPVPAGAPCGRTWRQHGLRHRSRAGRGASPARWAT